MVKKLPASAGDVGSTPGSGRSAGKGNSSPLQSSCLGNPTDRGVWWATVHGGAEESDTAERLSHNNNNLHEKTLNKYLILQARRIPMKPKQPDCMQPTFLWQTSGDSLYSLPG